MGLIMAQNGVSHRLTGAKLTGQVSPQTAVGAHITFGKLHIYIMQKPGKPPLLLILAKTLG